jgi:hypothetical protein
MARHVPLFKRTFWVLLAIVVMVAPWARPSAQSGQAPAQKQDAEYTALIKSSLTDARISTELVDHLPASDKVPTPLKFLGHIAGQPGYLTYAKDIHAYMKAVADAAPARTRFWTIGKTEEGRDQIVLAIASEATIKELDKYKGYLQALTDPRRTTEAQARQLISVAKPIYWLTSGVHSTERGGPEMLTELAYRLVVEETPFIQQIRNNVITFITPVVEVDGRERLVDTFYVNAKRAAEGLAGQVPVPYWGRYVAHDNNRDGMGQFLAMTRNVEQVANEWKPTVLHDLHEAQQLLYVSTGTGPYNEQLDPITINEWWMFAQNDVMEMTKRGVPGVWTYGFYDGWTPNYMFYAVHSHNATGRFYEVNSFNPGTAVTYPGKPAGAAATPAPAAGAAAGGGGRGAGGGGGRGGAGGGGAQAAGAAGGGGAAAAAAQFGGGGRGGRGGQSREWFRPNPDPGNVNWGPRAHVNMSQSGVLFALSFTGKDKERWLENYWIKNKNAVAKGTNGPTFGWVIPASQQSKANAAEAVNGLIAQGVEFHTATAAFTAGNVSVKPGDWIIRGDQPYRTVADIYFAVQDYSMSNPSPYDDLGWTYPMMRNLIITPVTDKALLTGAMAPVKGPVRAAGGISGTGPTVIVEHTGDNLLTQFRWQFATVKMSAAEAEFEAAGRKFTAGSFIIENANRAQLEPVLTQLGLSGYAVASAPTVKTHDLDVPRIGYIHSWGNTQDEGWVRAALDYYKVPYTYFGENEVGKRDLKQFDVILWPSGGAIGQEPPTTGTPIPYKKTADFQAIGAPDSTEDTRGGMGQSGFRKLYDWVAAGGTLITEGGTAAIFPQNYLTPGITVDQGQGFIAPGSVYRGIVSDQTSPIVYGIPRNHIPVYYKNAPLFSVGGQPGPLAAAPAAAGRAGGRGGNYQNTQPMGSSTNVFGTWDPTKDWTGFVPPATDPNAAGAGAAGGRAGGAGGGGGRAGGAGGGAQFGGRGGGGAGPQMMDFMRPRVILSFPPSASDMLLSGGVLGAENLENRPQLIDAPVGKGHVVMFAIRPFWRWQTQGTYILGFNTLMNWNDLNAGK